MNMKKFVILFLFVFLNINFFNLRSDSVEITLGTRTVSIEKNIYKAAMGIVNKNGKITFKKLRAELSKIPNFRKSPLFPIKNAKAFIEYARPQVASLAKVEKQLEGIFKALLAQEGVPGAENLKADVEGELKKVKVGEYFKPGDVSVVESKIEKLVAALEKIVKEGGVSKRERDILKEAKDLAERAGGSLKVEEVSKYEEKKEKVNKLLIKNKQRKSILEENENFLNGIKKIIEEFKIKIKTAKKQKVILLEAMPQFGKAVEKSIEEAEKKIVVEFLKNIFIVKVFSELKEIKKIQNTISKIESLEQINPDKLFLQDIEAKNEVAEETLKELKNLDVKYDEFYKKFSENFKKIQQGIKNLELASDAALAASSIKELEKEDKKILQNVFSQIIKKLGLWVVAPYEFSLGKEISISKIPNKWLEFGKPKKEILVEYKPLRINIADEIRKINLGKVKKKKIKVYAEKLKGDDEKKQANILLLSGSLDNLIKEIGGKPKPKEDLESTVNKIMDLFKDYVSDFKKFKKDNDYSLGLIFADIIAKAKYIAKEGDEKTSSFAVLNIFKKLESKKITQEDIDNLIYSLNKLRIEHGIYLKDDKLFGLSKGKAEYFDNSCMVGMGPLKHLAILKNSIMWYLQGYSSIDKKTDINIVIKDITEKLIPDEYLRNLHFATVKEVLKKIFDFINKKFVSESEKFAEQIEKQKAEESVKKLDISKFLDITKILSLDGLKEKCEKLKKKLLKIKKHGFKKDVKEFDIKFENVNKVIEFIGDLFTQMEKESKELKKKMEKTEIDDFVKEQMSNISSKEFEIRGYLEKLLAISDKNWKIFVDKIKKPLEKKIRSIYGLLSEKQESFKNRLNLFIENFKNLFSDKKLKKADNWRRSIRAKIRKLLKDYNYKLKKLKSNEKISDEEKEKKKKSIRDNYESIRSKTLKELKYKELKYKEGKFNVMLQDILFEFDDFSKRDQLLKIRQFFRFPELFYKSKFNIIDFYKNLKLSPYEKIFEDELKYFFTILTYFNPYFVMLTYLDFWVKESTDYLKEHKLKNIKSIIPDVGRKIKSIFDEHVKLTSKDKDSRLYKDFEFIGKYENKNYEFYKRNFYDTSWSKDFLARDLDEFFDDHYSGLLIEALHRLFCFSNAQFVYNYVLDDNQKRKWIREKTINIEGKEETIVKPKKPVFLKEKVEPEFELKEGEIPPPPPMGGEKIPAAPPIGEEIGAPPPPPLVFGKVKVAKKRNISELSYNNFLYILNTVKPKDEENEFLKNYDKQSISQYFVERYYETLLNVFAVVIKRDLIDAFSDIISLKRGVTSIKGMFEKTTNWNLTTQRNQACKNFGTLIKNVLWKNMEKAKIKLILDKNNKLQTKITGMGIVDLEKRLDEILDKDILVGTKANELYEGLAINMHRKYGKNFYSFIEKPTEEKVVEAEGPEKEEIKEEKTGLHPFIIAAQKIMKNKENLENLLNKKEEFKKTALDILSQNIFKKSYGKIDDTDKEKLKQLVIDFGKYKLPSGTLDPNWSTLQNAYTLLSKGQEKGEKKDLFDLFLDKFGRYKGSVSVTMQLSAPKGYKKEKLKKEGKELIIAKLIDPGQIKEAIKRDLINPIRKYFKKRIRYFTQYQELEINLIKEYPFADYLKWEPVEEEPVV
ncbi:hypothetical protein KAT08_00395 [Candidatus Babeliales bacterium]|nr:hypothetical protein [Candidatus Babeliales bacterium]